MSEYLSPANFAYARQALAIMKDVLTIPISSIPTLIHLSIGEVGIIWNPSRLLLSTGAIRITTAMRMYIAHQKNIPS